MTKQDYTMYIYKADKRTKLANVCSQLLFGWHVPKKVCGKSATNSTTCILRPKAGVLNMCLQ